MEIHDDGTTAEHDERTLMVGRGDYHHVDNSISTTKYNTWNFFPLTISYQFRRTANLWFLLIGIIMAVGYYNSAGLAYSAVSPWPTLVPLIVVVAMSIVQEAYADAVRLDGDAKLNRHPVTVIEREDGDDGRHHRRGGGSFRGGEGGEISWRRCEDDTGGADDDVILTVQVPLGGDDPGGADGFETAASGILDGGGAQSPLASSTIASSRPLNVRLRTVPLREIRAGNLVIVRNRDVVPADLVLLATSSEGGGAYVETSSIDGETNLKARSSARVGATMETAAATTTATSAAATAAAAPGTADIGANDTGDGPDRSAPRPPMQSRGEAVETMERAIGKIVGLKVLGDTDADAAAAAGGTAEIDTDRTDDGPDRAAPPPVQQPHGKVVETMEQAIGRIAGLTVLGYPDGTSVLEMTADADPSSLRGKRSSRRRSLRESIEHTARVGVVRSVQDLFRHSRRGSGGNGGGGNYVAMLTSELPNASVHTFTGKLSVPPPESGRIPIHVPLTADNLLLRGAALRNTEWAIGVAVFTGSDTKLVQNSSKTASKFSRLEVVVNRLMIALIVIVIVLVAILAGMSVRESNANVLWYLGVNADATATATVWPYAPDLSPPEWIARERGYAFHFFVFLTLLNQFVPLSMYISLEVMTFVFKVFIGCDLDMYHRETDTPAEARNTNVTDLGQVSYVFSDKTGTLTQNVMTFKRSSVDGKIYGAPMKKSSPTTEQQAAADHPDGISRSVGGSGMDASREGYLPLRAFGRPLLFENRASEAGEEERGRVAGHQHLTFNAEMFLRVMSICHTVVVETEEPKRSKTVEKMEVGGSPWGRFRRRTAKRKSDGEHCGVAKEEMIHAASNTSACEGEKTDGKSSGHIPAKDTCIAQSGNDGAPIGYMYQAESPDEGALVSAASSIYGFRFLERDSTSVRVGCSLPSILENEKWVKGLRHGTLTPNALEALTKRSEVSSANSKGDEKRETTSIATKNGTLLREEVWQVLAINKFDSDRKRMSVLARSPQDLGSLPMLLCKGADSSMLDRDVCEGGDALDEESHRHLKARVQGKSAFQPSVDERKAEDEGDSELATLLGMENHLGIFASEGLRTLVLGVRILTEEECSTWLEQYKLASSSMSHRSEKLKQAAMDIETRLHIVGATAIEDKLQQGVPEAIAKLSDAGIKLWVLTGDKRETAIEIGYSTKVLTAKMHLCEVADGAVEDARALVAMEFMRLVKSGRLVQYQTVSLDKRHVIESLQTRMKNWAIFVRRKSSRIWRAVKYFFFENFSRSCGREKKDAVGEGDASIANTHGDAAETNDILTPQKRRKLVRERANDILARYLKRSPHCLPSGASLKFKQKISTEHDRDTTHSSLCLEDFDAIPTVFSRSASALEVVLTYQSHGRLKDVSTTKVATMPTVSEPSRQSLDDNILFAKSISPKGDELGMGQPTILERVFAVDPDVRLGILKKHHKHSLTIAGDEEQASIVDESAHSPRALVIEGAALSHFLGDPCLEEMLFGLASCCDSVIACRVSPKQKGLLVKLVSDYATPTPVTLAIGDGANDVGMIQEAQIGVGISGLEGQQAVNSSDFSVAQFRFLENLLLVHGRWDYIRMAKMILLTFYTNLVLCGILIGFNSQCLYGGTPVFTGWYISLVNVVVRIPIIFMGLFDRDIHKQYVERNPQLYSIGQNDQYMSWRTVLRWLAIIIVHTFILTLFPREALLRSAGTYTSAWQGLMYNESRDVPGNGEGGGLYSYGLSTYLMMCFTFVFKVACETSSFINGECPPCTCRKNATSGAWPNRMPYTWLGFTVFSIGLFIAVFYIFELLGYGSNKEFGPLFGVTTHVMNMCSITWMLVLLVSTMACIWDVVMKMFGNMFFPTQTQVHMEIAQRELHHGIMESTGKGTNGNERDDSSN